MNKRDTKAYIIPETVDPEACQCIRVYVPDSPLYIAAFWASYEYLCNWLAWERDEEKRGKAVAAVWRPYFERAREEYLCSDGDCGLMDIRQKSGEPCIIEKQVSCEGDWEDSVNMKLCVPKMRFVGGVLQQDITGDGDWENAGDPEQPYDPRKDSPYVPPWVTPPAGQSGECLSAANVATYIDYCSFMLAGTMVDGLTFFQTVGVAVTVLTALMDLVPLTLLTATITALYAQVIDSWEDCRDFDVIPKLTEILVCRYESDGSMTESNWQAVISDLNAWRDTLTDNDERARWFLAIALVTLWGPVGMSIVGAIWGITSYECDYNECKWTHTFDFSVDDGGFELALEGYNGAVYSDFWRGTYEQWPDSYYRTNFYIARDFSLSTIKRFAVVYDFHRATGDAGAVVFNATIGSSQTLVYWDVQDEGDELEWDINLTQSVTRVEFGLFAGRDTTGTHGSEGSVTVRSITLEGTGVNPFV